LKTFVPVDGGFVKINPSAVALTVFLAAVSSWALGGKGPPEVLPVADREAEIQALKAQLAETIEGRYFLEAEGLGVVKAVRRTGLPDRQQRRLAAAIVREAGKNQLDPLLVVALIGVESSFNNFAVSEVGALGLMQIMPDTGKWLLGRRGQKLSRPTNLFDFELNVELGTAYLADLISRFGSIEAALVAYNAGPGAAKKILAVKANRARFIAGYPNKVVDEFKKLRRKADQHVAQATRGGSLPGAGSR
jgi:soluble lytic murein transglycosylase